MRLLIRVPHAATHLVSLMFTLGLLHSEDGFFCFTWMLIAALFVYSPK